MNPFFVHIVDGMYRSGLHVNIVAVERQEKWNPKQGNAFTMCEYDTLSENVDILKVHVYTVLLRLHEYNNSLSPEQRTCIRIYSLFFFIHKWVYFYHRCERGGAKHVFIVRFPLVLWCSRIFSHIRKCKIRWICFKLSIFTISRSIASGGLNKVFWALEHTSDK